MYSDLRWAAAEWVNLMRESYVCEQESSLLIGSGITQLDLMGNKQFSIKNANTL